MPNYRQLLNGIGGAGGAVGVGTYGALDQYKDEPWVGDLRELMHPDPRNRMGSTVEPTTERAAEPSTADFMLPPTARSWEAEHRYAPQGAEIAQGDAYWMSGGRPLPQRSAADAYRMGGLARMDKYKENTFRDIDRADIEDQYGGADIHGIKLPPVSRDEPKAWFDAVVPQTPLDVGLTLAGPAGRAFGKGAAALTGAAGVMGELVDPAEAGAGRILRDPRLWSPISSQKLRKPLSEMEHQYTDVRTPVPNFVRPEELVGGYGIFTPWDLSAANKTLTHVDALELAKPVRLHGGVGFPEANPGMAAASEKGISTRLDNQAARLTDETGKPVYIMPMTMSPSGIDASHHVADPLSQLVQTAKITKKDAKAFDDVMREQVPDWVGIKSKKFPDYINNLQGGMTTKALMADRMALAQWQEKGFPDVAAIRHATSEPALIDMPRNTTGMAISRYIPGQGLLDTTHPSYPKGVAGQYMGQLASLLPFEDAAPGIAKGLAEVNARNKALGKQAIQPAYHMGKPTQGVPTSQYFDDEWLDNIMKLWGER